MPSKVETTIRSRMWKPLGLLALAAAACAGLAGCGGGGSGPGAVSAPLGGAQVAIVPGPSAERPDLVVESALVSDARPAAGGLFTLSARVRNAGDGDASAATTVRFYRSSDETITTSDAPMGAASVAGLTASGSVVASVELSAPRPPASTTTARARTRWKGNPTRRTTARRRCATRATGERRRRRCASTARRTRRSRPPTRRWATPPWRSWRPRGAWSRRWS